MFSFKEEENFQTSLSLILEGLNKKNPFVPEREEKGTLVMSKSLNICSTLTWH